ncbi:MAG: hypothetical protein K9L87_02405 [Candidatus Omnitrophica bacterium]|nr:hypothetical protein [Candidatus Omnitrophota bacterium]MCF7892470.1 hypothetical protein [Candidatus Omnitrophota bacterium]MCF7897589.1 hypothetical protein [Candidatus Omnitrophota bacterium]MCF7909975.1 hypothetical protein [Candidatus Omnitrophota bacterium]
MKKIIFSLMLLSLFTIFLKVAEIDILSKPSLVLAQTEMTHDYTPDAGWEAIEEEQRVFGIFKTIYFPFVLLSKIIGITFTVIVGIMAIFISLIGIFVFEGNSRTFFIFLLIYLLGPIIFFFYGLWRGTHC